MLSKARLDSETDREMRGGIPRNSHADSEHRGKNSHKLIMRVLKSCISNTFKQIRETFLNHRGYTFTFFIEQMSPY